MLSRTWYELGGYSSPEPVLGAADIDTLLLLFVDFKEDALSGITATLIISGSVLGSTPLEVILNDLDTSEP